MCVQHCTQLGVDAAFYSVVRRWKVRFFKVSEQDVLRDKFVQSASSSMQMLMCVEPMPLIRGGVIVGSAKAANAGGVAVSALEMAQNVQRLPWSEREVDGRLKEIMKSIYDESVKAAEEYGLGYDLVAGANIAGFLRLADSMLSQGLI